MSYFSPMDFFFEVRPGVLVEKEPPPPPKKKENCSPLSFYPSSNGGMQMSPSTPNSYYVQPVTPPLSPIPFYLLPLSPMGPPSPSVLDKFEMLDASSPPPLPLRPCPGLRSPPQQVSIWCCCILAILPLPPRFGGGGMIKAHPVTVRFIFRFNSLYTTRTSYPERPWTCYPVPYTRALFCGMISTCTLWYPWAPMF